MYTFGKVWDDLIFFIIGIDGRVYEGPNIKESEYLDVEADKSIRAMRFRTPTFIDTNGMVYGVDYVPVDNYSPDMTQAIENGLFLPNAEVYSAFPEASNFETYSEYNQSLSEWYSKMQTCLGKVKLPNITGRRYYRPRLDLFEDQSYSEYDKSESGSIKDSPTPMKILESSDIDFNEMEISSWPENIVDPWDTSLLPSEPEPEMYTTFEAYEQAMKRWAVLCTKQMRVIPPHPSQLSQLILLRTAIERKVSIIIFIFILNDDNI